MTDKPALLAHTRMYSLCLFALIGGGVLKGDKVIENIEQWLDVPVGDPNYIPPGDDRLMLTTILQALIQTPLKPTNLN